MGQARKSFNQVLMMTLFSLAAFNGHAKEAGSLTLYVIPPPKELSWESPSKLASTTLMSAIYSGYHSIGHVTAKVTCQAGGQSISFWSGMTSSDDNPSDTSLLFSQKIGLGILFYPYNGYQEDGQEIFEDVLEAQDKIGRLFTIRFLLNEDHCERLNQYYQEYTAKRVGKVYGLAYRPRYEEGAGCTAYAASYVEVAGLLSPSLKSSWSKYVRVPEHTIGTPQRPVSMWYLMNADENERWAYENEAHRGVFFYDTQFMYDWAWDIYAHNKYSTKIKFDQILYDYWHKKVRVFKPGSGKQPGSYEWKSNKYFGLVIDATETPASDEPIWLN